MTRVVLIIYLSLSFICWDVLLLQNNFKRRRKFMSLFKSKNKLFKPDCVAKNCGYHDCKKCPVAVKNEGDDFQQRNDYQSAITKYEKAVSMESGYAVAWNNCAEAYEQARDHEQYLICHKKAVDLDPSIASSK